MLRNQSSLQKLLAKKQFGSTIVFGVIFMYESHIMDPKKHKNKNKNKEKYLQHIMPFLSFSINIFFMKRLKNCVDVVYTLRQN